MGYELVWIRRFTQFFGSTAQVFSVILMAVILGIGLGSLAYRWLRRREALGSRRYGLLELGIAVSAVLSYHLSRGALERVASALPVEQGAVAWTAAFTLVFVMTAVTSSLIGASLPWLHDLVASSRESRRAPEAYSAYNLGAAYGAVAVGIGSLLWLGYTTTCWLLAVINATVGAYFLLAPDVRLPRLARGKRTGARIPRSCLVFAMLIGFATLFVEAWVGQVADYLLGGTRIGVSATLATYFLGVSLGARLAPRMGAPVERLRATLAIQVIALAVLSVVLLFPSEGPAESKALATILLVVYAVFSAAGGAQFPALVEWMSPGIRGKGDHGAFTVAFYVETFAGVAGAGAFAFLAFRWLHTPGSLVFACGAYLLCLSVLAKRDAWRAAVITAGVICLILSPGNPIPAKSWLAAAVASLSPGDDVPFQMEDTSGWLMVVDKLDGTRELRLGPYLSGATDLPRRNTQVIQGVLAGTLLAPGSRALQIGYGTGEISRSLLAASDADLTVVELHPSMARIADQFFARPGGRLPSRVIRQDGVAFVRATEEKFDLILSNGFIVHSEMSARLYTRDHFEAVRRALRSGGLALVWVPTEAGHSATVSLLRTLLSVFPHVALYAPTPQLGREVFAVCHERPVDLLGRHRAGLARVGGALASDRAFPLDADYLWTRWIGARPEVERFVAENPGIEGHAEDRPVLEWYVSVKKDLVESGRATARELGALRDPARLPESLGSSPDTARAWQAALRRFAPLEEALERYASSRDAAALETIVRRYPRTNVAALATAVERALASRKTGPPPR